MHIEQMRQLISEYIEAYNQFDAEKMLDCFVEHCIFSTISNNYQAVTCAGKSELRSLILDTAAILASREQEVKNWILADNKAAIEVAYTAILAKDLPGSKAGHEIKLVGISIFEFENNKIKKLVDFS